MLTTELFTTIIAYYSGRLRFFYKKREVLCLLSPVKLVAQEVTLLFFRHEP